LPRLPAAPSASAARPARTRPAGWRARRRAAHAEAEDQVHRRPRDAGGVLPDLVAVVVPSDRAALPVNRERMEAAGIVAAGLEEAHPGRVRGVVVMPGDLPAQASAAAGVLSRSVRRARPARPQLARRLATAAVSSCISLRFPLFPLIAVIRGASGGVQGRKYLKIGLPALCLPRSTK